MRLWLNKMIFHWNKSRVDTTAVLSTRSRDSRNGGFLIHGMQTAYNLNFQNSSSQIYKKIMRYE